jgi:MFS family permease
MTIASPKLNFTQLLSLLLLVVIETIGIAIITPLLPALFLAKTSPLIAITASHALRNFYYGAAIAVWPLGMFFGVPFLGELSDKFGRKKIFVTCLLMTAISYLLSVLAIFTHDIFLFLFSRLFSGFFSGSYDIAQAAIADLSTKENKARNLSWTILAMNIGFVIGPAIAISSTFLSSTSSFSLMLPFLIAGSLGIANAIFVQLVLQETYQPKEKHRFALRRLFSAFLFVFTDKRVKPLATAVFFLVGGWFAFFTGIPLVLSEYFHQTTEDIGLMFCVIALSSAFSITVIQPIINRNFSLKTTMVYAFLVSSIILSMIAMFPNLLLTWIITILFVFIEVVGFTSSLALASNAVTADEQGITMGGMGGVNSLGFCLTSILVGFGANLNAFTPIIIAAIFYLLGGILSKRI